jgi:hypothetical protein
MIPSEVCDIADLINPKWADMADEEAARAVTMAAWRIHNAGYRKTPAEV